MPNTTKVKVTNFSKNLKSLRTERNLTLDKLASLLNAQNIKITKHGLSAYELGKSQPDIDTMIALSKVLEVSTDYLLGITEKQELTTDGKIISFVVEDVWQEACVNYLKSLFSLTQADELLPVMESLNKLVQSKFAEIRYNAEIHRRFIEYNMARGNEDARTKYFENATPSPKPPEESVELCKQLFFNSIQKYIYELVLEK